MPSCPAIWAACVARVGGPLGGSAAVLAMRRRAAFWCRGPPDTAKKIIAAHCFFGGASREGRREKRRDQLGSPRESIIVSISLERACMACLVMPSYLGLRMLSKKHLDSICASLKAWSESCCWSDIVGQILQTHSMSVCGESN